MVMPVTHDPRATTSEVRAGPRPAHPRGSRRPADIPKLSAEQRCDVNELILRVQNDGDSSALDELMETFDWLALSCARRMHRRGEPMDDLEQAAREALLGAISRFDVERGVPFRAFAWATTVGVLRRYYRSRWQLRVPRGLQELHLAAVRAVEELTAAAGRSPTLDELAVHLNVDREDVLLALDVGNAYRAASFDDTSVRGDTGPGDRAVGALDEDIENTVDRTRVQAMLASLPPRHRAILVMRFFEGRTQLEIGETLGISQVHVSRLMRAALASLREGAEAC